MNNGIQNTVAWNQQIRVLLCDNSAKIRVTLRKVLESDPQIRVADIARNGAEAVDKALRLRPDVIVLGLHMPLVDGVNALKDIVYLKIAPVIMLVAPTNEDAEDSLESMQTGAFDFITKPESPELLENLSGKIIHKIKLAAASNYYEKMELSPTYKIKRQLREQWGENKYSSIFNAPHSIREIEKPSLFPPFKTIVLGVSTGGPKSLFKVLPFIPADFEAAILVVQHMPPPFLTSFAQRLAKKCNLPCRETQVGMEVEPGNIYVASGGYHTLFTRSIDDRIVIRHSQSPQHLFMPSVDIAMKSVCSLFGSQTIGVLMTGMGSDGAEGMVEITTAGGLTIAESEETAIVFGMPLEAIKRGGARRVVPNREIAAEIIKAVA